MLVGLAIWTGYQAGFIATTYSLATWVLAAAAAIVFTGPATALIAAVAGVPKPLASSIAFVLVVTKIGEDETEKLDLPDGLQLAPDPVAERQLFDLVNDERAQRGLAALAWDTRLVPIARAHSEEMFRLKYFGHQSPTSGSPFDRLKKAALTDSRAGRELVRPRARPARHPRRAGE